MLADGLVSMEVIHTEVDQVVCRVVDGGTLRSRQGINLPGVDLSVPALTAIDRDNAAWAAGADIDFVGLSFVRSEVEIHELRNLLMEGGSAALVVAKIEKREALEKLEAIVQASDAVMVARGDLGSECSIEELPILQKEIIRQCIALGRPAITATQMLETMVANPEPTRAEASDVANAVWDGSSAVMLSGETAIGVDPVNVVATMSRIAERADEAFDHRGWASELSDLRMTDTEDPDTSTTDAMTQATARAVEELGIGTILCVSGSGFTVRSMARFRPAAHIVGLSADERTVRQLTLSWGPEPIHLPEQGDLDDRVSAALEVARNRGAVRAGELVGVLAGTDVKSRSTNALRIERVPEA